MNLSDVSKRSSYYNDLDRNNEGAIVVDCFDSELDTNSIKGSKLSRKMTMQSDTTVTKIKAQVNHTEDLFLKAMNLDRVHELEKSRERSRSKGRKATYESPKKAQKA